jgi:hypothetical protein
MACVCDVQQYLMLTLLLICVCQGNNLGRPHRPSTGDPLCLSTQVAPSAAARVVQVSRLTRPPMRIGLDRLALSHHIIVPLPLLRAM